MNLKIRVYLLLELILINVSLYAQTKGAVQLGSKASDASGRTYAVVVGISDYQDEKIPDLRFADKDALAFAEFLQSPGGGALPAENLRILTNKQATAGQVIAALTWLLDECKPGDQAIIYFSGHGDVETKLLNQLGFLLLWDSPARAYLAGALPVDMLRQVVSTLSVEQKTKVFLVVDACRAGKLAGTSVIGTQLTSNQLAQQFSSEMKILSCQPNEYSIEGEQWGGGRGVFSYHLCNGFYGLADADQSGTVNLFEIGRYLEDRVPREVSPVSQIPLTMGDKSTTLFQVDRATLSTLKEKGSPPPILAKVEQRGLLHEALANADSISRIWYARFERTLAEKHFFEPANDCSEYYFQKMTETPALGAIVPALRRNYAAALQDDAQQALNIWLKGDPMLIERILNKQIQFDPLPRQLGRAAELLGEGHYMFRPLLARKYLFEGINSYRWQVQPDVVAGRASLGFLMRSVELEPLSPVPWCLMAQIYAAKLRQSDSAFICAREAQRLAPLWVVPYAELSFVFDNQQRYELSNKALMAANAVDSIHPYVLQAWANWYMAQSDPDTKEKAVALFEKYKQQGGSIYPGWENSYGTALAMVGRFEEAESAFKRSLDLDPKNASVWNNLGELYQIMEQFDKSEEALKKCLALDSTLTQSWDNLGKVYAFTGRNEEAEASYKRAIALDSDFVAHWNNLADLYLNTNRLDEAEAALLKAKSLEPNDAAIWNNLGTLYYRAGLQKEAEEALKKALSLDSNQVSSLINLGGLYSLNQLYTEAELLLQKAKELDPQNPISYRMLGTICFKTKRAEDARQYFLKTIELSPTAQGARLGLAYVAAEALANADPEKTKKLKAEALNWITQAIEMGATYPQLEQDQDLNPLKSLPEWGELMSKHFPKK